MEIENFQGDFPKKVVAKQTVKHEKFVKSTVEISGLNYEDCYFSESNHSRKSP